MRRVLRRGFAPLQRDGDQNPGGLGLPGWQVWLLSVNATRLGLSEHDGFTSMPRFAEDLEVAVGWLQDHPAVTSVGVIAHCVGAGAAILCASRSDVRVLHKTAAPPAATHIPGRTAPNRTPTSPPSITTRATW